MKIKLNGSGAAVNIRTFNLDQWFLLEVLEELVKEVAACRQHRFVGSELVTCRQKKNVLIFTAHHPQYMAP